MGYVDYYDLSSKFGSFITINGNDVSISTNPAHSQVLLDNDIIRISTKTTIRVEFKKQRKFYILKPKAPTPEEVIRKFLDNASSCSVSVGASRFGL